MREKPFRKHPINMAKYNVIVEGNIGSGKTTFLEHFKKNDSVCVLSEPIDLWRNCNGHNLLGLLYQDVHRWSFSFQSYVLLSMMQQHTSPTKCSIKLMERSIYSARYCFVERMLQDKLIEDASAAVLDEYFKWIVQNTSIEVDLIVYLRTTPQVVYQRMLERNREEEKSVSLEYLTALHEVHEDWLLEKKYGELPAPVLVLDANLDRTSICEEYKKSERHIFNLPVQVQS